MQQDIATRFLFGILKIMTENKTQETAGDVDAFLNSVLPERRRGDALVVKAMMERVTGLEAKMWGEKMIGFGTYHYKYDSGREGDWFRIGLSPNKANLSIYIIPGFKLFDDILNRLGKYKNSVGCLYITNLKNVDLEVLEELLSASMALMDDKYPNS